MSVGGTLWSALHFLLSSETPAVCRPHDGGSVRVTSCSGLSWDSTPARPPGKAFFTSSAPEAPLSVARGSSPSRAEPAAGLRLLTRPPHRRGSGVSFSPASGLGGHSLHVFPMVRAGPPGSRRASRGLGAAASAPLWGGAQWGWRPCQGPLLPLGTASLRASVCATCCQAGRRRVGFAACPRGLKDTCLSPRNMQGQGSALWPV